jgi:alkylation response protein AidB-like acyl-CoA dehydrogenase
MAALAKGRMSVAAGCGHRPGLPERRGRARDGAGAVRQGIAGHQLVQQLIADIAVDTAAARLLVWQVADLIDRNSRSPPSRRWRELFASEASVGRRTTPCRSSAVTGIRR